MEREAAFGKALRYFHRLVIVKADITWDDLVTHTGRRWYTEVDWMQTVDASCQLITEGTQVVVGTLLFSAVDKQVHAQYAATYQQTARTGALRILTATNRACSQGLVVIRNLAAQPHEDSSDYKKGWVAMCCFLGDFTGGELVIPALKMMFKFQPRDVIFFRSTLLEHYVLPFTGDRTSLLFFTHHNVIFYK